MKIKNILKILFVNTKNILASKLLKNYTPKPYKVLIQLTNDCNSRCKSCHIWKINLIRLDLKKAEMTIEDFRKFFTEYGSHIYWLSLSGGEVALYDEWDEFIELVKKHCPKLCLINYTTNGLNPDKNYQISKLIKEKLRCDFFVTISLDGDEKVHDELRGVNGNYSLANKTREIIKSLNVRTYWGLTLSADNSDHLSHLPLKKLQTFKAVSLVHSEGIYQKKNFIEEKTILSALEKIVLNYKITTPSEIVEFIYLKIGVHFLKNKRKTNLIPCEVINTNIHINPYGEILPCMFLKSIGNLKVDNVNTILKSEITSKALAEIKKNNCPKCWMNCYAPHSILSHPIKSLRWLA